MKFLGTALNMHTQSEGPTAGLSGRWMACWYTLFIWGMAGRIPGGNFFTLIFMACELWGTFPCEIDTRHFVYSTEEMKYLLEELSASLLSQHCCFPSWIFWALLNYKKEKSLLFTYSSLLPIYNLFLSLTTAFIPPPDSLLKTAKGMLFRLHITYLNTFHICMSFNGNGTCVQLIIHICTQGNPHTC